MRLVAFRKRLIFLFREEKVLRLFPLFFYSNHFGPAWPEVYRDKIRKASTTLLPRP